MLRPNAERGGSVLVEKTLVGMRAGGFREVLVSPHLAYRDAGVPGRIPPGALLRIRLWVRQLRAGGA